MPEQPQRESFCEGCGGDDGLGDGCLRVQVQRWGPIGKGILERHRVPNLNYVRPLLTMKPTSILTWAVYAIHRQKIDDNKKKKKVPTPIFKHSRGVDYR